MAPPQATFIMDKLIVFLAHPSLVPHCVFLAHPSLVLFLGTSN